MCACVCLCMYICVCIYIFPLPPIKVSSPKGSGSLFLHILRRRDLQTSLVVQVCLAKIHRVDGRRSALYTRYFLWKVTHLIRGTFLKSTWKDQKGRVAQDRVAGLVSQYQASLQTVLMLPLPTVPNPADTEQS